MSAGDESLRSLERAAGQGDRLADMRYLEALRRLELEPDDPRLLAALVRVGRLRRARVDLAARLGHPGAASAVGRDADPPPADIRTWLEVIAATSDLPRRARSALVVEACLALLEAAPLDEGLLRAEALALGETWLTCSRCYGGECEHDEERGEFYERALDAGAAIAVFLASPDPGETVLAPEGWIATPQVRADVWATQRTAFERRLLQVAVRACALCDEPIEAAPFVCEVCQAPHHYTCLPKLLGPAPEGGFRVDTVVVNCADCERLQTIPAEDALALRETLGLKLPITRADHWEREVRTWRRADRTFSVAGSVVLYGLIPGWLVGAGAELALGSGKDPTYPIAGALLGGLIAYAVSRR